MSARFDSESAWCQGSCASGSGHRSGHPLELPVDLDPLFFVNNSIVEYAGDLGGIALGRVCVKDDLPILTLLPVVSIPLCEQQAQVLGALRQEV